MKTISRIVCLVACLLGMTQILSAAASADQPVVQKRAASMQIPIAHPRLLILPADLPGLRNFLAEKAADPLAAPVIQQAIFEPPSKTPPPRPAVVSNGTAEGTVLWRKGYDIANETGTTALRLAFSWLLTGKESYARACARWLLGLAAWKIDSDVLRTNDELFIQHFRPMIVAYDWCHDGLTAEERTIIAAAIRDRARILAAKVMPMFSLTSPTPPDNSLSHPMRFISTLGLAGYALWHEAAEAPGWAAWAFEYYLRQYPVWGGDAGGYSEGLAYWGTGTTQHLRFLEASKLLGQDEALQKPFFRNNPWFALYFSMPYSFSSFGDLCNIIKPSTSMRLLLEKLALMAGDPRMMELSTRYATTYPTGFPYYEYSAIDSLLHLYRVGSTRLSPAPAEPLAHSRLFADVGWVAMHTAMGDPENDAMLGFKSSPQGSVSHGMSDQNSFVVNAFGQALAISSGNREWYGSPHHVGWTRTTQSKNALLFDGATQPIRSALARGTISRFVMLPALSFATGNALEAWSGKANRALRHVLFADRRYWLVLDDAESPEPIRFQWMLHALNRMQVDAATARVIISRGQANLAASILLPRADQLKVSQTDQYTVPIHPDHVSKFPPEWHVKLETITPAEQARVLAWLYPWKTTGEAGAADQSSTSSPVPARAELIYQTADVQAVLVNDGPNRDVALFGSSFARQSGTRSQIPAVHRIAVAGQEDVRFSGSGGLASSRSGRWLLALVDGITLAAEGREITCQAPCSIQLESSATGARLVVQTIAPQTLQVRPGFAVKTISGLTGLVWSQNTQSGVVEIKLLKAAPEGLTLDLEI